ncbi:RNA-binding S4 domain-containing protein [Aliigemmobacter aestuarii]|uniref:RNA-binding S4 domain-containing protein n=1 Tax=Aliigemmobacter aestuarii TaxID=1445661 RepID=A0A4S3MR16_9RHOB|nr:RNA-binding S4 domain-containing protein [Gemmobacter aestuarii]THD84544.1 RNA-binding S4 domain-containing protein [Gemmobacter aestuarii]
MRIDKWLWQARFFKTRGLATDLVAAGHLRLNGQRVAKPAQAVGAGDTLTFPQGGRVRLIRVTGLPGRRGPASEAQSLYLDLDAPAAAPSPLE